jgi:hypothetical protein
MTPEMVRRFWALIQEINQPDLLRQQDDDVILFLLKVCQQQHPLSNVEPSDLNQYITSRLPLIRDLALG